jgi:hypothetical protein
MAGKGFDKVIYKSGYEVGNEIHNRFVESMWNIIETHVEYLRSEEYFGLTDLLQS